MLFAKVNFNGRNQMTVHAQSMDELTGLTLTLPPVEWPDFYTYPIEKLRVKRN